MDNLLKYFPDLSETQIKQFEALPELYKDWNAKINVISRKDIENIELRHIIHSLAIAKFISFRPGTEVLDLGTGGGFPGIPLAILFPETNFFLVDGTLKKIKVVQAVIEALGLKNARAKQIRAEEIKDRKFDFVVTRAVATLDKLVMWCFKLLKKKQVSTIPNGLIALKGGNIEAEAKGLARGHYVEFEPINDYFDEALFNEKFIVYVQGE